MLVPASKQGAPIARDPRRRATSTGSTRRARACTGVSAIRLKYGRASSARSTGITRVSKPGRRVYRGRSELPRVMGGLGRRDRVDVAGRDDRPRGVQARASAARSSPTSGSERDERTSDESGSARQPIEIPGGVEVAVDDGNVVTVKGPRGELDAADPREHAVVRRRRRAARRAPRRRGLQPRPARADPHPDREHGRGRHERLREAAGDRRGRLPRRPEGQGPRGRRWATRTRCSCRSPRASSSRSRADVDRRARQRQAARRRGRREHPQDPQARAVQGQGHPLRGRVRAQEGRQGREGVLPDGGEGQARGAHAPARPRAQEGARRGRAAAPGGVPVEPAHLRPADRRRAGPRPSRRPPTRRSRARTRPSGRRRSASCSPTRAKDAGDRDRRVRPRRPPVPRPGGGPGRRRP